MAYPSGRLVHTSQNRWEGVTTNRTNQLWIFLIISVFFLAGCSVAGAQAQSPKALKPIILSGFGSVTGAVGLGGIRSEPHTGIDFGAIYGSPILAAAPGEVVAIRDNPYCGNGVVLRHDINGMNSLYYSVYCHMSRVEVKIGQMVERGEVLGRIGTSGHSAGIPHVHFGLAVLPRLASRNEEDQEIKQPLGLKGLADPTNLFVGCFNPTESETYAAMAKREGGQRLVLTFPVCS